MAKKISELPTAAAALAAMQAEVNDAGTSRRVSLQQIKTFVGPVGGGGSGVFVNPDDFGAVGDNATDDTAAINSAISSAVANNQPLGFGREGPYRINGVLDVTGPMTWHGHAGARINFHGGSGAIRFTGTNLPFFEMSGMTVAYAGTSTGAIGRIGLITTNDITKQGFNSDPPAGIDRLLLHHNIFESCKVALSFKSGDRIDFHHNAILYENAAVRANPYGLHIRNSETGPVERIRINHNYFRAHVEDDGTINTGGGTPPEDNMDFIKWTAANEATAPRMPEFCHNYCEMLNPTLGNIQMDTFFGGSGIRFIGNFVQDMNIHTKGDTASLPWTSHRMPIYLGNHFRMTHNATPGGSDAQRRAHACLFLRGGGMHLVVANQFEILASNKGTNAIRFDNNITGVDAGWPNINTDAPVLPVIVANGCILQNRTDHRFIDADPAGGGFTTSTMALGFNSVVPPSGQAVNVVNADGWNAQALGNHQHGSGNWGLGALSDNNGITFS